MAADPTATLYADSFKLYVNDDTTAAGPTNVATALGGTWNDVGYLDVENINFASEPQITEIYAAGVKEPIRIVKTREPKTFSATMLQFTPDSLKLALNGGTLVVASGVATYTPVDDTILTEHQLVLEVEDGTSIFRFWYPRVQVRTGLQMPFPTGALTTLPVTVNILQPTSGSAYKIISNHPALVA